MNSFGRIAIKNKNRVTVVLTIILMGLKLAACQCYAYSKVEDEIFNDMDQLSTHIPRGLVEQEIERAGSSEQYIYSDSEYSAISKN